MLVLQMKIIQEGAHESPRPLNQICPMPDPHSVSSPIKKHIN